jgi:hypothetical protein
MTAIKAPGLQWVVSLPQLKLGYTYEVFTPRVQHQEKMCSPWEFLVDDRSESSSTYDMTIVNRLRSSWVIRYYHHFNDQTVTWDTKSIQMKDRNTALYHQ